MRKQEVGDEAFADWDDLDRGDLVGVRGYMFRSKMGELTLHVTAFTRDRQSADARCPTSGTACKTSRSATASATST